MGVIRINQTKMLFGGDKTAAKDFIGQAKSQMEILLQEMSFQNLHQGMRRVQPYKNVWIECRKIFDYQECRIFVTPSRDEVTIFACWDNDYFMEGSIVERQYDTKATQTHTVVYIPGANPPATEEYHIIRRNLISGYDRDGNRILSEEWDLPIDKPSSDIVSDGEIVWQDGIYPYKIEPVIGSMNLYTVEVCVKGSLEVIENVCGNNLAIYSVGQPVVVAKYNKEEPPVYLNNPLSIEDPEYIITPFVLNKELGVWFKFEEYERDEEKEWYDTVVYGNSSTGTGGIRLHSNDDYNSLTVQPCTLPVFTGGFVLASVNSDFRTLSGSRRDESGGWVEDISIDIPIYLHGDRDYYKYIARGVDIPIGLSALDRLGGGGNAGGSVRRNGSYYPSTFFEHCVYLPDGRACDYPYEAGDGLCAGKCDLYLTPVINSYLGLIAYNDGSPERSSVISWLDEDGNPTRSSSGSNNYVIFQEGDSDDPDKSFWVWDLDTDSEAKLLNYAGTEYISFPCDKSDLQHWLTAVDKRTSKESYDGMDLIRQYANYSHGVPIWNPFRHEWYWLKCDVGYSDYWDRPDYPGIDPLWLTTGECECSREGSSETYLTYHMEIEGAGQCTTSSFNYLADIGAWTPTGRPIDFEFSATGENIEGIFDKTFLGLSIPSVFTDGFPAEFRGFAGDKFVAIGTTSPTRAIMIVNGDVEGTTTTVGCDLTHDIATECSGVYSQYFITGSYHVTEQTVSTTVNWQLSTGEISGIYNHLPSPTEVESGSISDTITDVAYTKAKTLVNYFIFAQAGETLSGSGVGIGVRGITVAVVSTQEWDSVANTLEVIILELKAMQTNPEGATLDEKAFSPYPELEAYMKSKIITTKTYDGWGVRRIEARVVSMPYSIPLTADL